MRRHVLIYGLLGGLLIAPRLITLPFQDRIGFDRAAVIGQLCRQVRGVS
jgi:hypothetical protein